MDEHTEATVKQPLFTVVRGRPDDVELAALTAVLLARLRSRAEADEQDGAADAAPRAPWGAPGRRRPRVGWTALR